MLGPVMEESTPPTANQSGVHSDSDAMTGQPATPPPPAEPPKPPTVGELRRERKQLWDAREQSIYHVGGLAVDLRRRGVEDVDLVNRRADEVLAIDVRLNEVDAALARVDSRRRGAPAMPAAGHCGNCGAPFQHDAAFCFRCGARVLLPEHEGGAPGGDQPTAIIERAEAERS